MFEAYRYRWESSMVNQRAEILAALCQKEGITSKTIDRINIIATAKSKKTKHFFNYIKLKEKLLKRTIYLMKNNF